jgi:ABC-type polysaccharide/polyol phosphate export permease
MPLSSRLFGLQAIEKFSIMQFTVPRRVPGTLFVRNLVERRSLLFQLVRRDFEQRFVGSAIGWIWGLIHPLVLLLSWVYIFQVCLKQPPPKGVSSYPLFIFSGMLPWLLFSDSVQRSAASLLDQANLITKSVFPSEIVPVSVFLSSLVSHLLAMVLMVGAAAVVLHKFSAFLLLLPVFMFLVGLFSVGLGWVMASLHVFLRDTAQFLSVVLTFWFWMTPIMIPEDRVPHRIRFVVLANPMNYAVRVYRSVILDAQWPNPMDVAILGATSLAVFVLGGLFFRYMKRGFADVL